LRLAYFGRQGGVLQQELRETKQTYRLHALAPRDVEAVNERRQAVEHGPQQFRMLDYIIGSCQTIQVRFFVNEVLQGVHESLVHYNGQLLKQTRPENWNCQIRRQIQKHHTCPQTHELISHGSTLRTLSSKCRRSAARPRVTTSTTTQTSQCRQISYMNHSSRLLF